MKKIISLAVCFVLGSFVLAGCSDSNDPFAQKEYAVDGSQIEEIRIDVRDRQIEVLLSQDEQVHIQYYENGKEYYDILVSDQNVLTMASISAVLENLTLSTTNADVILSALAVTGSISISSNGGNITFGSLDVGNALSLTVKNGDISGTVIGSYEDFAVQSESKKGQSNLPDNKEGGQKTLKVSSNNGDVNVEFADESL